MDNSFDRNVPTLVFKMGRYPVHHGGLGVLRSLHRVGIPVYANHEDSFTPAARSRHLGTPMVWVVSPCDTASNLERLEAFSDSIGKPMVIIPTDDEAALFIARQRERLQDRFLVTATEPSVIESVADKLALASTVARLRMPTVRSATPRSEEQLLEFLDAVGLPVVLKASDAALVRTSGERSTILLRDAQEAIDLFRGNSHIRRGEQFLQEFIRDGQDWFFHGYSDASSKLLVGFAGVKLRSYPPLAGPTSFGQWVHNDELLEQVQDMLKAIQYRGICDLDLRFDFRDQRFKLLDFNPRVGAQFRLFEDNNGIDVVRALHLDLTGRAVSPGTPRLGRTFMVETVDPVASRGYREQGNHWVAAWRRNARAVNEWAWWAPDDPLPLLAVVGRLVLRSLKRKLTGKLRRRDGAGSFFR